MEPIKTTQITGIWSYLETVDWTDPWFSALLGFHVLTCFVTFITRNRQMWQALHFGILLFMVYSAESLNEVAAKNWKLFSRQQYFDSKGMFISLVWSSPLLMNSLIIVMLWILNSSQLMVMTGRLKLQHDKRSKENKTK
uniref:Transmembrane protein 18 n=1 Tax=Arion vulgaris TaxID=1028688 RepID=A0A0B6ZAK7_9EUPU